MIYSHSKFTDACPGEKLLQHFEHKIYPFPSTEWNKPDDVSQIL